MNKHSALLCVYVPACGFYSAGGGGLFGNQIYILFVTIEGESKPTTSMVTEKKSKEKKKEKNRSLEGDNESSAGSRRTVRLCLCYIVQY